MDHPVYTISSRRTFGRCTLQYIIVYIWLSDERLFLVRLRRWLRGNFFFIFKTRLTPSARARDNIAADTRYSYTDLGGGLPRRPYIYLHRYSYVLCILLFSLLLFLFFIFFLTITVSLSNVTRATAPPLLREYFFIYCSLILYTYVDICSHTIIFVYARERFSKCERPAGAEA